MNALDQEIAIAKVCGWTHIKTVHNPDPSAYGRHSVHTADVTWHLPLPDYLNDLNAIDTALAYLKPEQVDQFAIELSAIVLENDSKAWWDLNPNEAGNVINATASQRAEAFLKTLNLWERAE